MSIFKPSRERPRLQRRLLDDAAGAGFASTTPAPPSRRRQSGRSNPQRIFSVILRLGPHWDLARANESFRSAPPCFRGMSLVADVEGDKVRLSANGNVAVTMEQH